MDGLDLTKSTYARHEGDPQFDPYASGIQSLLNFGDDQWVWHNGQWTTLNKNKESVLQEAERIINGERAMVYGQSIDQDFGRIGELWSVVINSRHGTNVAVSSDDVGLMMVLLKVARAIKNKEHRDSLVDIAGYAGCVAKLRKIDQ